MRKYLYCENGFVEKPQWMPNCWVNVECPDQSDFEFLTKELKVPEAFLEDIADMDERPRTDTEENWLLTIIRIPLQQQGSIPYITIPIGIITNNEIIVTVCYHSTEMIPDFIDHTRRKGIIVPNKFELILRLIYSSAVWFLKYLKQINNDVAAAEKELERSIRNEDLLRLMKLQKTLVYFNTSIRGNEVMVGKLQSIFQEKDYQNRDLVEDVVIELKQAYNTVNIYSDILTGTMDAFASIISNNVNTIMKRMTSISIILMVPTLIASFYGMNVDVHVDALPHAFSFMIYDSDNKVSALAKAAMLYQNLCVINYRYNVPNLHPKNADDKLIYFIAGRIKNKTILFANLTTQDIAFILSEYISQHLDMIQLKVSLPVIGYNNDICTKEDSLVNVEINNYWLKIAQNSQQKESIWSDGVAYYIYRKNLSNIFNGDHASLTKDDKLIYTTAEILKNNLELLKAVNTEVVAYYIAETFDRYIN